MRTDSVPLAERSEGSGRRGSVRVPYAASHLIPLLLVQVMRRPSAMQVSPVGTGSLTAPSGMAVLWLSLP